MSSEFAAQELNPPGSLAVRRYIRHRVVVDTQDNTDYSASTMFQPADARLDDEFDEAVEVVDMAVASPLPANKQHKEVPNLVQAASTQNAGTGSGSSAAAQTSSVQDESAFTRQHSHDSGIADLGQPEAANRGHGWQEFIRRNISLAFEDSVLEDGFQAMYWRSRQIYMFMGALSGFVWTCVMCTTAYLKVHFPHIYELCCNKIYVLHFGQAEFIAVVLQLPVPLLGAVLLYSRSWARSIARAGYSLCRWDARVLQTNGDACDAAVLRIWMNGTIVSLLSPSLMMLVASKFQILGVQPQLQWVISCFGTIMQLLFLPHMVWIAVVLAVGVISSVFTVVSRSDSTCVGAVLFQVFVDK